MGKSAHNDVLDGCGDVIKQNCTRIVLCSQEPTTFAEANVTYALADVTVDSNDFTLADGNASGRMLTVAAQNAVNVDSTGTSTHAAYLDVANSKLLYVNDHTSQALTSGNTVDINEHDIAEVADPAAPA